MQSAIQWSTAAPGPQKLAAGMVSVTPLCDKRAATPLAPCRVTTRLRLLRQMGQGPNLISAAVCRSGSSTSEPDAPAESESESDMGTSWYCVSSAAGDAVPAPLPDACATKVRLCLRILLKKVEITDYGDCQRAWPPQHAIKSHNQQAGGSQKSATSPPARTGLKLILSKELDFYVWSGVGSGQFSLHLS